MWSPSSRALGPLSFFLVGCWTVAASGAPPSSSSPLTIACDEPCGEPRPPVLAAAPRLSDGFLLMTAGARVNRSGADGSPAAWGGGVVLATYGYTNEALFPLRSFRGRSVFAPGGGATGFDGELVYDLAAGHRISFGEHHGVFGRVGFDAEALRGRVYFSKVELPQVQLGYQVLNANKLHVELAARGGFVLIGRENVVESSRRPLGGSVSWGGYATFGLEFLRFELEADRYEAHASEPKTPVYAFRGSLCGLPAFLMLCADARHFRGDQQLDAGGTRDRSAWYGALTVSYVIPLPGQERSPGAVPDEKR
jgi:hypothetical protein